MRIFTALAYVHMHTRVHAESQSSLCESQQTGGPSGDVRDQALELKGLWCRGDPSDGSNVGPSKQTLEHVDYNDVSNVTARCSDASRELRHSVSSQSQRANIRR